MAYIVVTGIPPYDGRYDIGFVAELTTREWGLIKRHAGYMPLTVGDGYDGMDPELFAILAVLAIRRAGRIDTSEVAGLYDRLGDAPFGTAITLEDDDSPVEDDAGPPEVSSNGKQSSSGDASTTSSETSEPTPSHSGIPASATSQ